VDQDHISWKSWKLIARTISPRPSFFVAQRPSTYSPGEQWEILGRLEVRWKKVACWTTKAAISLKRVKIDEKLLYGGPIGTHQRSFERYHPRPPTASPSPKWGSQPQRKTAVYIISGTGKVTECKFFRYIHRVHANKSPLKIWEKRKRGRIQGLPKFVSTPYYLRTV